MRAWILSGFALVLCALPLPAQTLPNSEDCRTCHLELEDERLVAPARLYDSDVHAEVGFGCLACHGSGGPDRFSPAEGFLSSPTRQGIPEMCGRCHADPAFMRQFNPSLRVDQVAEYWSSSHGILLAERNDPGVATCTDCHVAHQIRPPSDPESSVHPANVPETCGRCHSDEALMVGRSIGTDQVEEYAGSVHGRLLFEDGDLSAPVCNDCHGNHGAAPPGVSSVRSVCGQCHSIMAEFFDQSAHSEVFDEEGLPGCATCHGRHAIELAEDAALGPRSREVCQQCHDPADAGGRAFGEIALILDSLEFAYSRSRSVLDEAHDLGMEVSQALFELEDITNARHRARSAVHAFSAEAVLDEVSAGFDITERALDRGEAAMDEHRFRRVGLGVSAGIIFILIIAVLLKIREMEERVEQILSSLSEFFTAHILPPGGIRPTAEQLRLAACAILVEAAYADESFSEEERAHLIELVRNRFGLVRREAEELLELAERQRMSSVEMGQLAGLIAEHLSDQEKEKLLVELWQLVYSDGVLTEHEVAFLEDVAKLLHVDPETLAAARRGAAPTAPGAKTPSGGSEAS